MQGQWKWIRYKGESWPYMISDAGEIYSKDGWAIPLPSQQAELYKGKRSIIAMVPDLVSSTFSYSRKKVKKVKILMVELQGEKWRSVKYKGIKWSYRVSDKGRICNKHGYVIGYKSKTNGYVYVSLNNKEKSEKTTAHRLVAETFIGLPNGRCVHHIDGDRANNCVENLVYSERPESKEVTIQGENWKPVIYRGIKWPYIISDMGRVRNKDGKEQGSYDTGKYVHVGLCKKGEKSISVPIHRLVAAVYIGPCPEGMIIRHLDGGKENNCAWNLAYGTHQDNTDDMYENGSHFSLHRKITPEQEYDIRKATIAGAGRAEIMRKYNVGKKTVGATRRVSLITNDVKEWILSDIEEDGIPREVGEQVLSTLSRIGYLKVL